MFGEESEVMEEEKEGRRRKDGRNGFGFGFGGGIVCWGLCDGVKVEDARGRRKKKGERKCWYHYSCSDVNSHREYSSVYAIDRSYYTLRHC